MLTHVLNICRLTNRTCLLQTGPNMRYHPNHWTRYEICRLTNKTCLLRTGPNMRYHPNCWTRYEICRLTDKSCLLRTRSDMRYHDCLTHEICRLTDKTCLLRTAEPDMRYHPNWRTRYEMPERSVVCFVMKLALTLCTPTP